MLPDDPPGLPELGHVGDGLGCQSLELVDRVQQLDDALKTPLVDDSSEDFPIVTNSDQDFQRPYLINENEKPCGNTFLSPNMNLAILSCLQLTWHCTSTVSSRLRRISTPAFSLMARRHISWVRLKSIMVSRVCTVADWSPFCSHNTQS